MVKIPSLKLLYIYIYIYNLQIIGFLYYIFEEYFCLRYINYIEILNICFVFGANIS